jgi:hypothetical protein
MLSAIESAKLLLLGHCDASFQTLGPHNPNRDWMESREAPDEIGTGRASG